MPVLVLLLLLLLLEWLPVFSCILHPPAAYPAVHIYYLTTK
eukprot:SAG22_NODE_1121_length_5508_cov_6.904234_9_plen_41_part_00